LHYKFLFIIISFFYIQSSNCQVISVGEWLGEWEATFEISGGEKEGTVKETISIKEIHNRTFVNIFISGGFLDGDYLEFKYTNEIFLTFDFEGQKILGLYIDDRGFNGMMQVTVEVLGDDSLSIKGENNNWDYNSIWKFRTDGSLYKTFSTFNKNDSIKSFGEALFRRKQ
jgi:hypothetical protein